MIRSDQADRKNVLQWNLPTSEGTLGGDRSTVLRDDHRAEPRDRVASVTWRAALFTSVTSTLRS